MKIKYMLIKIPMRFEGTKGDKILYALFDSGATYSCISDKLVSSLTQTLSYDRPLVLATASIGTNMHVSERCILDFFHEDIRLTDEFLVVPGMTEDVIIGATTMQKWRLKLDFEHDCVRVDPKVAKLVLMDLKLIG